MAETIDLSGDGGVLKTVVRKAKDDAIVPSDSLPLVDGTHVHSCVLSKHCICNVSFHYSCLVRQYCVI